MLITVSGMVGSGKSTAVKRIADVCQSAGVACQAVRFRSVGLLGKIRPMKQVEDMQRQSARTERRWHGFQPRSLTPWVALGYATRMLAFRFLGPRPGRHECVVLDRYFYDSFVHYSLSRPLERLCLALLRRLIPVPDLAFLLQAPEKVIAARRPEYAPEYVAVVGGSYDRLPLQFPELVPVRTDQGESAWLQVESMVREKLQTKTQANPLNERERV